jgi:hypothetical protein
MPSRRKEIPMPDQPTKEEMLARLNRWRKGHGFPDDNDVSWWSKDGDEPAYQALLNLIESSPEPGAQGEWKPKHDNCSCPECWPRIPSPAPDVDEAMDTLHGAAYDGLCHKYHPQEKEWWADVLKAEAVIRAALQPKRVSREWVRSICDLLNSDDEDERGLGIDRIRDLGIEVEEEKK